MKNVVQSLAKGFRVLEAFDAGYPELTLSQISGRTGLDTGTVFRLANTLVMLGYLERVEGSKRYRLTLKVLDLGFNTLGRMEFRDVARPVLRSLVGQINEAASIGILDGADIVYVERVQAGMARLGVDIRIGSRIPAYYTAIGHCILAFLPKQDARRILNMRERIQITPKTVTSIAQIEAKLAVVRKKGYAFSDRDAAPMLLVLAAPILDDDGHPFAALSVAAPSVHISAKQFVDTAADPLMEAANKIGRAISIGGASGLAAGFSA
ncbi:MAG: IclR family transcriptional regulator [Proteobacteria bacterium]|nr:IclR family transcriptional regulator [Pseudomonadota bacterium]